MTSQSVYTRARRLWCDESGQFDLSGFFDSLAATLEGLISALADAIVYVYEVLQAIAIFLYGLILSAIQFLVTGFQWLFRGLVHIISDVLHLRIAALWDDYLKVKDWLTRVFGPVLKILFRIRAWYDQFVLKPMYQIIALIQRVRQVLQIFKLFHLGWAQKLDNALAGIEGKIIKNVLTIRQRLNQVISLIDLLVDPDLLLTRFTAVASFFKGLDALLRGLTGHGIAYLFGITHLTGLGGAPSAEIGTFRRQLGDAANGAGPIADAQRQAAAAFQVSVKGAGT